ncbi:MAG: ATP-binding protein [Kiritimatiellae bacterium]|nr:ATP-binding protein [Kiritimatiellia bacterium]
MKFGAAILALAFPVSIAFAVALTDPLEIEPKYANRRHARPIVFASGDYEDGAVRSMSAKFELHNRPGTRYGIDFAGAGGSFEVLLNNKSVCTLSSPPYICDITAFMRVGENELVVETLDEGSFLPTAGDLVELKVEPRPTTVAEIMSADRDAIRFKPPCVVTGVVAFAHAFINDTAVLVDEVDPNGPGVYMSGDVPEVPKAVRVGYDKLRVGDRVEVIGMVDPLIVRQGVVAARITKVGKAELPSPPLTRLRDVVDSKKSNTRVRFEGVAGEVKMIPAFENKVPELTLETDEGPLRVHGLGEETIQGFSGKMVYVDGVMMPYVSSSGVELAPVLEAIGDESIHLLPGWSRLVAGATAFLRTAAIVASVPLLVALFWLLLERRRKRIRDLAVADERRRIAAELHDSISQYIAGTQLLLRNVAAVESSLPPEQKEALSAACEMLDLSRIEVGNAIHNLRNDEILTMRLDEILALYARRISASRAVAMESRLEPLPRDIATEVKGDVMAVVQEAVTNAVRHGKAANVRIACEKGANGGFRVSVENDGKAFDSAAAAGRPGHLGLEGMQERGRRSGFAVSFRDDGGWRGVIVEELK